MKKITLILSLLILGELAVAQTLQFNLVDISTGKSIEGVKVFSHEVHDKISYTDRFGLVLFDTDRTDTLIFFKDHYQALYIHVQHSNFDTTHTIVLKMIPSQGLKNHSKPSKFDKFQTSSHNFTHDSVSTSTIKITQYYPVGEIPKYNDKALHLVEIGIDGKSTHRRSAYTRQ